MSVDISTTYLGLKLKSPFIVASSELTDSIEKIVEHEQNGAGAVVLKSLFEEQILAESYTKAVENMDESPDAFTYIQQYQSTFSSKKHIDLIEKAKKSVSIPIIASINCVSNSEWINYTKTLETAGADAIELNIAFLPTDIHKKSEEIEKRYFEIAQAVKHAVKIPVSIKMSYEFSSLPNIIYQLSLLKIDGFVLFNRFYQTDINLHSETLSTGSVFTNSNDFHRALRSIGLLSGTIKTDFAASTGIHSSQTAIKMLLSGAKAVELASILYKNGSKYLETITSELKEWMTEHQYHDINSFIGKCNFKNIADPSAYSRIQFMKYFSKIGF